MKNKKIVFGLLICCLAIGSAVASTFFAETAHVWVYETATDFANDNATCKALEVQCNQATGAPNCQVQLNTTMGSDSTDKVYDSDCENIITSSVGVISDASVYALAE
ncbi:DUF6520 family protein [Zhouia sp. PK063]|uniref:DUF6520 family protein n=1 Tax=Zhouia sp. PK063 TaxID=3373602 RepID=UPI0037AC9BC1